MTFIFHYINQIHIVLVFLTSLTYIPFSLQPQQLVQLRAPPLERETYYLFHKDKDQNQINDVHITNELYTLSLVLLLL